MLLALLAAAALGSQPASCSVAWQDGKLVVRADRPIQIRQGTLREPERRILDLLDADLADPRLPARIDVGEGGIRQIRVARHPETRSLRVVLDLDTDAALRTDIHDGGRLLISRLAWGQPKRELLGPPVPDQYDEPIGPPAPWSPEAFIGPPAPPAPPAPRLALRQDEVAEPVATRSAPWPAVPQVVLSMRIRRLTSGATTVELRGRGALMAWVHEEVEPRRLTIRVPRSSLACAAPRARGAVERVTLRREPEAWALGLDLADGRYVLDTLPSKDGKALTVRIEKAPALDAARPLVLVDAGHGGYDPGALGPTGKTESQVALGVARQLARSLAGAGFQAVMLRTADAELRLADRETLIGRHEPVALVSLHCNSSDAPDATGIETYFRHESGHGLARAIQEQLIATTGRPDRGVRTARLFVLRGERTPAALVEMGFISSPSEERQLADPAYQKVLAEAIATGIKKFYDTRAAAAASLPLGDDAL